MNHDRFNRQVDEFVARVSSLDSSTALGSVGDSVLQQALQELAVSVEELRVAQDELAEQNLALGEAHHQAEGQRRRYQDLFMSAPDGYLVTDGRGVIAECNQAASRLLGLDVCNLLGKPLVLRMGRADRARCYDLLSDLRAGAIDTGEHEVTLMPVGQQRLQRCMARLSALRDAHDELIEVRWMLRDLSDREHARRAERLAEEAQHKDRFLAMLGHELRNPLAPLVAVARTMLDRGDELPAERRRWGCQVIVRQAEQLGQLVDDLLDVSRLARGTIAMNPHDVDLSELVQLELDNLRPRLAARWQEVVADLPAPLHVHGDPTRLRQIIANLLDNASKYTADEGHLTISLSRRDDTAVLRIADDGTGIDPTHLEQIFNAFDQGGPGEVHAHGLGLGLSLVRTLVQMHGGTVRATSKGRGHGSEFTVELPALSRAPVDQAAGASARLPRRRILVVDDNADAADALAMALEEEGNMVAVAYDARTARALIKSTNPELALIDLAMPGIDGFTLARTLTTEAPGLIMIAVSGFGDAESRRRGQEAGFRAHMTKPVDLDQLESLLDSL